MKSQLYSMQSIEDAKICVEAGADRIGVLASNRHGESRSEEKRKEELKEVKAEKEKENDLKNHAPRA